MKKEWEIDESNQNKDSEGWGNWLAEAGVDTAKSLTNEFLLDFGDEAFASIVATYVAATETPKGGDMKDTWAKSYRKTQQYLEKEVEKSRKRSPYSTFIAGLVTPTILSKFKFAAKMGEGTLDIIKSVGKGNQQLLRTGLEGALAATGRSQGGQTIKEDAWNGAIGAGLSVGVHRLLKGVGQVAEHLAIGDKAKVASDTLGGYLTAAQKYTGKAKNTGRTTWEASKRIYNKMFSNKLVTHANVDWDPHLSQFVPRKGYKVKAPNVSDIERNLNTALKISAKEVDKILKEAGKGEVGTPGIVQFDIAQIFKNLKTKIQDEYTGEDGTDAIKVINEMINKSRDLVKRQGNSVELLNDLRKEMDKKIRNSFGDRGEKETSIVRDINKMISGELRGAVKGKIKDPAASKKFELMLDDMEDFYEVRQGVRLKGEIKAKGSDVEEIYATKPGAIRSAMAFIREHAGVPYHIAKETPSGSSAVATPRLNTKKTKDIKYFGAEYEPGQPTSYVRPPEEYSPLIKTVPREAIADMPSRIGRAVPEIFEAGRQENLVPVNERPWEIRDSAPEREPQQAFQPPGLEQVDQMMGQAEQMNRVQMQQEKRQKEMLDKLRMAKLPRNSQEFVANKELVMAKFAQDAPEELGNVSHILSFEPDKIEDMMTVYSMQYPQLFINDQYKRINGKIVDNVAKNRARKETFDREDIPTSEKAAIIDKINKTAEFTADIDTANKIEEQQKPTGVSAINDVMAKLKAGQPIQKPAQVPAQLPVDPEAKGKEATGMITTKTKEGKILKETPVETLDVF